MAEDEHRTMIDAGKTMDEVQANVDNAVYKCINDSSAVTWQLLAELDASNRQCHKDVRKVRGSWKYRYYLAPKRHGKDDPLSSY